mgnify:CR=1 FL=1
MQQDDRAVTTHRVAVFDLDGTVTRHDTLVPFLVGWAVRHPRHLWRLWRLPFSLSRFALGLSDRGRLKAAVPVTIDRNSGVWEAVVRVTDAAGQVHWLNDWSIER